MKFQLSQEGLKDVLTKLGKVLTAKSSIPILAGVLVEAKTDCLLFTGSDGSESIIHRIPVGDGTALVEAEGRSVFSKDCIEIAKKLKGMVAFEVTGATVKVSQDKTKLDFGVLDAADYPSVANTPTSKPIIFSGEDFSNMVSNTYFAASKSEIRPILMGIHMSFSSEGNVFVATDSHRLGKVTFGKSEQELKITVPAKTLESTLKFFDLEKEVFVFPSETQIAFANGNTILYSRLLEGNYPDTGRLIPKESKFNLVVSRKELLDALELFKDLSKNSVVKMKVDNLFVELKAFEGTTSGIREIAFESYDGEEGFTISFSAKFVADALKPLECTSVRIGLEGPMKPFTIHPITEEATELQLILPVRDK
ncbi:DNA polymerase III subunit beta [Cytobacillus pseudoceanisediminis]